MFFVLSCSNHSKQIESVKIQLSKTKTYTENADKFQFLVDELTDKETYNMLFKKYQKAYIDLDQFPDAQAKEIIRASKYLNLAGSVRGDKVFYRVHAYRIAGDTLDNVYIFLDDKNQYIDKMELR